MRLNSNRAPAHVRSCAARLWPLLAVAACALAGGLRAQSIQIPWGGFAHTPQHNAVSLTPSQPLNRILWTLPLGSGAESHYSPPVITRANTVIIPANPSETAHFTINALVSSNGATLWQQITDYKRLPPVAICPIALTPRNRLYVAGAGGTVWSCDTPDAPAPVFSRTAFYGSNYFNANLAALSNSVFITTPITSDRYGDIFFGFEVVSATPVPGLQSGLARIDYNGNGTWINATNASGTNHFPEAASECAPALSLDEKTLYMPFTFSEGTPACLSALDSRTLALISFVRLIDPDHTQASVVWSSASPTIGPDGDVFMGVSGATPNDNDERGWLLHFDPSLSVSKIPGLFGWDATASVVDASLVPSYTSNSSYLLAIKYNDYITGRDRMSLLDPQAGVFDSTNQVSAMAEIETIRSPTVQHGNDLFEWCVNTAAVDPFTKSILINNEDGNLYRWDLPRNQLVEKIRLTTDLNAQAYTPTVIGGDGIVYSITQGSLFAVGR